MDHTSRPRRVRFGTALRLLGAVVVGFGLGVLFSGSERLSRISDRIQQGTLFQQEEALPSGHWGLAQPLAAVAENASDLQEEISRLKSLGYVGGSIPFRRETGITIHLSDRTSGGLRFFTSGHQPGAYLMDTDGTVLHRWELAYEDCMTQSSSPASAFEDDPGGVTGCWRRAHLFDNGDVLAVFEGHGLAKVDHRSRLIWSYPGRCHHDLDLAPDGSIFVLTREAGLRPRVNPNKPVLLDFITQLSADGEFLASIDLFEAFAKSNYASHLEYRKESGDIFHTNTLELLDGRLTHLSPVFAAGNILISVRELGVIAIVDPGIQEVVWALSGLWAGQHQPTLLANGNILLFDNLGHGGRSKVIEFHPFSQEIVWAYQDSPEHPLYSKTCGSNQRLDNGNTLITESDNGRALEVAHDGTIVWEFRNPERTGRDNRFIAAIMDMVVLPVDFRPGWIGES